MKKSISFLLVVFFLLTGPGMSLPEVTDEISWLSVKEAQSLAEENDKKILIFAEAEWCTYCKKMNKEVFTDPAVIKMMNKYFYPVRLDVESDKKVAFNGKVMTESQFAVRHRVSATPTTFFIDQKGEILGAQPGFVPADVFEALLSYIGTNSYNKIEFDKYLEQHSSGK